MTIREQMIDGQHQAIRIIKEIREQSEMLQDQRIALATFRETLQAELAKKEQTQ